MGRGPWWATVHRVAKRQQKWLSMHTHAVTSTSHLVHSRHSINSSYYFTPLRSGCEVLWDWRGEARVWGWAGQPLGNFALLPSRLMNFSYSTRPVYPFARLRIRAGHGSFQAKLRYCWPQPPPHMHPLSFLLPPTSPEVHTAPPFFPCSPRKNFRELIHTRILRSHIFKNFSPWLPHLILTPLPREFSVQRGITTFS